MSGAQPHELKGSGEYMPHVGALFAETFLSDNFDTSAATPTLIEAILEPDTFLVSNNHFLVLKKGCFHSILIVRRALEYLTKVQNAPVMPVPPPIIITS